jgi:hypothetical protein
MTIFEFLMVLISIVLALGVAQLLRGLGVYVRSRRRFAPAVIWGLTLFYIHLQMWWSQWDLRVIEEWNQFLFLYDVASLSLLYLAAQFVMPVGVTTETDWEEQFFSMRRWFFGTSVVLGLNNVIWSMVLLGIPFAHPYRIAQITLVGILALGLVISDRRVHLWIAIGYLATLVTSQILFRLFPVGL